LDTDSSVSFENLTAVCKLKIAVEPVRALGMMGPNASCHAALKT
jgi:hypothetical protein